MIRSKTSALALASPEQARDALALAALRLKLRNRLGDVHAWRALARPGQLPPEGDWQTWYIIGGRGAGKTWTSAHTLAEWTQDSPGEYGIVAPTYADARDVCVEGESGILAAFNTDLVAVANGRSRYVESWSRSLGVLRLRNGSTIYVDGADDGATRIQGHNLSGCWASEIGLWRRWRQAWEESIRYAVRHGGARIVADGTPKRGHGLVRLLVDDDAVPKSRLRTYDNIANLNARTVEGWVRLYGGTALGRQELEGEVLEDVPGAAWQRDWIERFRLLVHPELGRVTIGIDPAATSTDGADATGIVAAGAAMVTPAWCRAMFEAVGIPIVPDSHGATSHQHYFVLEDASAKLSPAQWGQQAVSLYRRLGAGHLVAETNRGGEMVEHTLRTIDPNIAFRAVHATRGKVIRAEPIAALYEQGRVHHVGFYAELEDEMCSYVPGDSSSPDRMDALVWALTDLAIGSEPALLTMYRNLAAARAAGR